MKRRDVFTLFAGAATSSGLLPLAARAQQPAMPVIGFLYAGSPEPSRVAAFAKGLSEMGYIDGRNVAIEYRSANSEFDRLPELAADLVRRRVDVIAAIPTPAALAAKAATTTIPIVVYAGSDPVQLGLVASLNRPGGNVTGVSAMTAELGGKRLGLLHELLPRGMRFGLLINPNAASALEANIADTRGAAASIGGIVEVFSAGTNREIDAAFTSLVEKRVEALMVPPAGLFLNRRVQLATLAARHAVPTIFSDRAFAEVGGLMSYAPNLTDQVRQVGIYVGRILKGEKPADLPVMRPTRFELVINQQTARLLGLTVPPTLLAIADEVIE
jgi:putative tryptophan/tyrosine transport system substrate-binding protein